MSFKDTSSARWRGRAIAVAGIAAAATVGGLALATAAQAAAASLPTLTLSAPATVLNTGVAASPDVSLRVNNTQASSGIIPDAGATPAFVTAQLHLTITGVATLPCAAISFTADTTGPTSVGAAASPALTADNPAAVGTCTFSTASTFTQAANSDVTYNWALHVAASPLTGTLSTTGSLSEATAGPPPISLTVATSNTKTTALVAPSVLGAATFGAAPPAATVYSTYDYTLATSVGNPASSFSAFGAPAAPDSTTGIYGLPTARFALPTTVDGTVYNLINLDDTTAALSASNPSGLFFNAATGHIVSVKYNTSTGTLSFGPLATTNWKPAWKWTIIANNGQGGATTASPGIGGGSATQPTPPVAVHDVDSPAFTLPILFSDVSAGSTFANEIYSLTQAASPVINGYIDGTFRPTTAVNREQFAAFLARELGLVSSGPFAFPCGAFEPSGFSDVSSSNPFCEDIRDLAKAGVVNGYKDGSFHPMALIYRQEATAMLYRAYAYKTTGNVSGDATCTSPIPFNDVTSRNVFCGDIEWMASHHFAKGFADGGFHPLSLILRQETAAFLFRMFGA